MDQEVLQDLYNRAVSKGYSKSIEEFSILISSDQEVLEDNYNYVRQQGYQKPIEDFQFLVGVKKKDTPEDTVSLSEDGLLEQPTITPQPEPAPQEVSVVDDTTVISGREERGDTLNVVEPTPEGGIKPELIAKTEEYVVPELNYKYGDQGFVFEEADAFGDEMVVRAANGNTINVELDVFLGDKAAEAKKLNDFIEANKVEPKVLNTLEQKYQNNKIKFDTEEDVKNSLANLNKEAQAYSSLAEFYLKRKAKVEEERAALEALTSEQRLAQTERIKAFNQQQEELRKLAEPISRVYEEYKGRETRLNQAIGDFYAMKSKQGGWSAEIYNKILEGTSRIAASKASYAIQALATAMPFAGGSPDSYRQDFARIAREKGLEVPENINKMSEDELRNYYSDVAEVRDVKLFPGTALMAGQTGQTTTKDVTFGELIEEKIYDERIKQKKKDMLPDIRSGLTELIGDKSVTEQWALAKQEGFWGGAILGLAESIPAMVAGFGGNWALATADMMNLTSDFLDEEMSGPEFDDVLEKDKLAFKLPVAIISGVLETYGLRNIATNSGLRNSILMRILRKPKKDLTGVPFQQIVKNEVDSMLKKGLLTVAGGSLTEFETGAAQQIVDIGAKEIFNAVKEKELFQTPESFAEGLGQVLRSGAQEAVGGFIMSVPGAMVSAVQEKDFSNIDNNLYEMFKNIRNDKISRTGFVQKIKGQIIRQEITKEEGEKQIADYEEAIAISNQIPVNTPVEQEKVLMGLLLRKKELTEEVEGKDPVLVEKQKQEIDEINNQIRAILETTTKETIKEEGEVEEKPSSLKTKVEKEQAVDIESFFGDEVEETTETVTDNLSINRSKKTKTKTAKVLDTESALIKIAQRGAKAVSKILPKTRIILHETTEEFEKFAAPGRGEYDPNADVIHVNLENALVTTVPHEIFHAVFLNKVKTDPAAAQLAETMMRSVRKALPATSELAKRIDTFAESYTDVAELQNEERLAELIGILSSEYKTLSKPNKNKVVKFIENLARQIGVDLKISEFTKTDEDVIDLLNTLAGKVATGEELVEGDVQTLEELDNGTNPIGSPTEIRIPSPRQQLDFKESYTLSLITPDKSIDLISLIEEIKSKDQKVWFWVADQLGSGIYNGVTLDAGPSFPYGNIKVNEDAIWATGIPEKDIQNKLKDADYIFIMSGSPQQSKLFNKKVYDVFTKKLGDYSTFKQQALETKPTKALREVLEAHDTWESLRKDSSVDRAANAKKGIKGKIGTGRKKFLQALILTEKTKTTAFHKLIQSLDGYVSVEELRDGFYKENDFKQNDIMLVLKPTGYSLESNHSTYDKEILGEVIGVPDVKVDAFDVMPQEIADKYAGKPRTELSQAIAPFGSGIRKVTPERLKRQQRATEEYISEGREAGFKDTVIIDYLSRVRKVPMEEIKSAMEIVSEGLGALPASFKNIQGGAKSGLKLFKKIDKLVQKEKKKKKPLADSQILEKAIEYMQRQPEYKNEADTYKVSGETRARKGLSTQQMLMEIDLQKTLGMRPTQDMSRKLGIARAAVKQRIKGIRDVQKVKTELKNFMRKALPARILLSRDAQKMFRYIERVTPDFMQSTQAQGAKIDNVFKEITDFVAEENNKLLERDIENILNGKYEKTVNNRRVAQKIDADTKARIDSIKKMLPSSNLTPEQINEVQEKLNQEFNKLNNEITAEENPSNETLDRMADLQIAISYSSAMVQSNTDPIKTQTLDDVYSQLQSLIEIGSSNLKEQLKESAKKYRAQMAAMYYDITGIKIDPQDENFRDKLEELDNIRVDEKTEKENENRIKSAIKNTFKSIENTVFGTAEALTGLMDRISSLPGEMMGGISQELVTERINESSIKYKKRMMAFDAMLQDKLKEYYGKNWKKKSREFRNSANTYKITEGRGRYNKLTQDQMYYLYNQYKDPATHPAFKNMFGKDYKNAMENLTKQLKPEVKAFADWQVEEFFPAVYDYYNKTYKEIYRTNMPQNQNYAGRIYRLDVTPEPLSLLGDTSTFNTQVSAASTLVRSNPALKIEPANGTDALVGYVRDMEYFAAYGVELRDIQKLFGNGFIKSAIKTIHGDQVFGYIDSIIKKVAGKGIQLSIADRLVNKMTTLFVVARIGLSPLITIKQLTSAVTYANDIGILNWLKYSAKNLTELKKVFKEISDNSVYMQDRGSKSILNQIESYANTSSPLAKDWIPGRATDFLSDVIMYSTRLGDRGAIYLGGSANYSYYKDQFKKKNPGASEQQVIDYAIKRFERDTKETQQSSDLQDKDLLQNSGAFYRAFNIFLTTPKQYLRKEISASRNLLKKIKARDLKAGKGTFTENVRQLLMYHVFMPVFFQWVSSGFPMPWNDWEDEDTADMVRAALLGNLNALFIFGDLISTGADFIQKKPWYKETTSIPIFNITTNLLVKFDEYRNAKTPTQQQKKLTELMVELAMFTGLPAKNIQKMAENYPKLLESEDFGEFMLRLLNYSKYQIEGRPKKQGTKKKPMSMTEMKKFYPEMYEMIKEMEDPELKQLEKDIRELEKEMLESMYE